MHCAAPGDWELGEGSDWVSNPFYRCRLDLPDRDVASGSLACSENSIFDTLCGDERVAHGHGWQCLVVEEFAHFGSHMKNRLGR
jgi:hypothetical protein